MNLIGFLGEQRDGRGFNKNRWNSYRPSVALCMHEDLSIDVFYLIYKVKHEGLMQLTKKDIEEISPKTSVVPVPMDIKDDFDPMDALEAQYAFIKTLNPESKYLISLSTGTHVNHVAWFDLVKKNIINADFIQSYAFPKKKEDEIDNSLVQKGLYRTIDIKTSKYDGYYSMLEQDANVTDVFLKDGVLTKNEKYNAMIAKIEKVSLRNNYPMLIDGPTGAGKSQLAERLYMLKKRKGIVTGEFRYINCATLTGETAQSVLFGHKKGAFTGASESRKGIISLADKGVLFLDEIGALPYDIQGMLLVAIEKKKFFAMGSDTEEESDFSLICGTNEPLQDYSETGKFRADLLARIDLWKFTLPGLVDRLEDIEPNLDYELNKFESTYGESVRFNTESRKAYLDFSVSKDAIWKRNFRDLSSSVIRMATLCENHIIDLETVKEEIELLSESWGLKDKGIVSSFPLSKRFLSLASEFTIDDSYKLMSNIDLMTLETTLDVCLKSASAKEAASKLYSNVDGDEVSTNPSSRLNNYLKRTLGWSYSQLPM